MGTLHGPSLKVAFLPNRESLSTVIAHYTFNNSKKHIKDFFTAWKKNLFSKEHKGEYLSLVTSPSIYLLLSS